jgi:hypothetical protein
MQEIYIIKAYALVLPEFHDLNSNFLFNCFIINYRSHLTIESHPVLRKKSVDVHKNFHNYSAAVNNFVSLFLN